MHNKTSRFLLFTIAVLLFSQTGLAEPKPNDSDSESTYAEGIPEKGLLTLKTGSYSIPVQAESAWTIDKMFYRDKQIGLNNGHYGTVLAPTSGKWWGTGHKEGGREIVHQLKLTVDGKAHKPITTGGTVSGNTISLVKDSTIWKFKTHAELVITNDHIFERTQMEVLENCQTSVFYYFMHAFPPTTTKWLAQLPDGSLQDGPLTAAGKMAVNTNTRWTAQYDPTTQLGLLCYTPKIITGIRSGSLIWDLDRYHKYYLRQNLGETFKKGQKFDYTVIVKAVPKETGDWTATKAAAEQLIKIFPIED